MILFDRKIDTKLKFSIVCAIAFSQKYILFFSFFFIERSNIENIGKEINCGLPQEKYENTLVIC